MAVLLLVTVLLIPVAAWLGSKRAWWASLLALWPGAMTVWLAVRLRPALAGQAFEDKVAWVPSLGLELSFRLDGLSAVFAVMVTGVGTGIVVYAAHYLNGHPHSGRFQASLFLFMTAMLGVVLTDNLLALFVFWELTGFASYLLIGFEHEKSDARRSALQALIVTGGGGLCLLAAAVLIELGSGTFDVTALLRGDDVLRGHAFYVPIVLLILIAAFTKSAQFPFHFWLPDAMAAPTPASAYLHSATMVKAGIYLIARMNPLLGGTALWTGIVVTAGALTMVIGAVWAVRERDLKRILAFSTVSALGTVVFLLGLGTPAAMVAAIAYVVAHACYKGTLFLIAGIIDHETHTRDVTELGGLRRQMPRSALVGALGAASMLGLPLSLGFVAKELAYDAVLDQPWSPYVLAAVIVTSSGLLGSSGLLVGFGPFAGKGPPRPKAHDPSLGMWLPALVLAAAGLALGVWPPVLDPVLSLAASDVVGSPQQVELALWHGLNVPFALSAVTLVVASLAYSGRERLRSVALPPVFDTGRVYRGALSVLDGISTRLAPPFQSAPLTSYILVFIVTSGALGALALHHAGLRSGPDYGPAHAVEVLIAVLIAAAAGVAVRAKSTMGAVLSLGTIGYGVALLFLIHGAPDLAMTQFTVETLTAVILVYVFWQFPVIDQSSRTIVKLRDAMVAGSFGVLMTLLSLQTASADTSRRLGDFFAAKAPLEAHGRNIVNVILVDFRALDTLGEITVLTVAAIGVRALLKIAAAERAERAAAAARSVPKGTSGEPQ